MFSKPMYCYRRSASFCLICSFSNGKQRKMQCRILYKRSLFSRVVLIFYSSSFQCINLELSEVNGKAGIHKHSCKSHQQLKTTGLKHSPVCMKSTAQTQSSRSGLNNIYNLDVRILTEIIPFKQVHLFQKDPTESLETLCLTERETSQEWLQTAKMSWSSARAGL